MKKYMDFIIPHVGIALNWSPLLHFFRDLLFAYILWQIGFRGFQAALATMLISGFWEAGNGINYSQDGSHSFFDFLDLLPSVFAGFIMVSILAKDFDFSILQKLSIIFFVTVVILLLLNKILGRKIYFKK